MNKLLQTGLIITLWVMTISLVIHTIEELITGKDNTLQLIDVKVNMILIIAVLLINPQEPSHDQK